YSTCAGVCTILLCTAKLSCMGLRETITRFFQRFFPKKEYPLYKTCTICGERVYLPFRCEYCGNYYCDRHRLPLIMTVKILRHGKICGQFRGRVGSDKMAFLHLYIASSASSL